MPVLSIEDRGRAIGYLESGRTVRTVAELFHVSTAMNHANLYRVLFNFSVQYDFLYFLCNFAIFTFAPWNRQMNVFTHA